MSRKKIKRRFEVACRFCKSRGVIEAENAFAARELFESGHEDACMSVARIIDSNPTKLDTRIEDLEDYDLDDDFLLRT